MKSIGNRFKDLSRRSWGTGRQSLRYQFELYPKYVENLPPGAPKRAIATRSSVVMSAANYHSTEIQMPCAFCPILSSNAAKVAAWLLTGVAAMSMVPSRGATRPVGLARPATTATPTLNLLPIQPVTRTNACRRHSGVFCLGAGR